MAETLVEFHAHITSADGVVYTARACGGEMPDGRWQGWVEFTPLGGGRSIRSGRETTQPNRRDTEYWASGLTPIYLEGALARALGKPVAVTTEETRPPTFDEPAPPIAHAVHSPIGSRESALDPFSVYEKGELLLRKQLGALSSWHLVNIVVAYDLSDEPIESLNQRSAGYLIDAIVRRVRERQRV